MFLSSFFAGWRKRPSYQKLHRRVRLLLESLEDRLVPSPVAAFSNNGPANEGSSVKVAFSNPSDPSANKSVNFHYSFALNAGGLANSYSNAGSNTSANFTFNTAGTYTIYGRIWDKYGSTTSSTTYITVVTINDVAPTVKTGGPYSGIVGTAISFSGSATSPDPTDTYSFLWNFGDGATSTKKSPNHAYTTTGTFTVNLQVTDNEGNSITASTTASVSSATTTTTTSTSTSGTYYVSPTGNDSNSGSASSPWLTLQFAVSQLQPGNTLNVEPGSYTGFIVGWDPVNSGVYSLIAGTAGNPITIQADPSAPAGSVVINAQDNKTHAGIDLEPGCNYISVSGFTINGVGIAAYPNHGEGIKLCGSYDVASNNTISGVGYGFGIIADDAADVVLKNNTITGTGNAGNAGYGHGIYLSGSIDGAVVQGNVLHDNSYIGIHIDGYDYGNGTGLVTHALIAGNWIYNNGQNGINADGLQSSTIENNLIYGYKNYGICLYHIDAPQASTNNILVNNTIVSTASGAGAAVRILDGSTGNTLYNNILLGGSGIALRISNDSLSGLVSNYNIGGGVYQSEDTGATQTLAQWQAQTGQDMNSFTATASQLFVSPSTNNYQLASGSPAIGAGTATDAPSTDILGNAWPNGGVDIGAY
jgi:PKD repeat protein